MTPAHTPPSVAFLGLGIMGSGMARRLVDAGHPVTVYNRTADRARPLAEAGAAIAASPREAAAGADMVFTMVADDAASRAMWQGDDGALAGVKRGTLLVESSTVTVARIGELAALAKHAGCTLIDAPVTEAGNRQRQAS